MLRKVRFRRFYFLPDTINSNLFVTDIFYDSFLHLVWAIPTLLGNYPPISSYKVSIIRRRSISTPNRIIHLIHQYRYGYPLRSYRIACQLQPCFVSLRFVYWIPILVIGIDNRRSPTRVYCMCFLTINDYKMYLVTVFVSQLISGSAPLPEWWSGERTENHQYGFLNK